MFTLLVGVRSSVTAAGYLCSVLESAVVPLFSISTISFIPVAKLYGSLRNVGVFLLTIQMWRTQQQWCTVSSAPTRACHRIYAHWTELCYNRPRAHPVTLLIISPGEWCVLCSHKNSRQVFGGYRRYGGCGGQGQGVREGMQYVYRCCMWWRRGQRGNKVGGGRKSKQKPKKPSSGELGPSTRSTWWVESTRRYG